MNQLEVLLNTLKTLGYTEVKHVVLPQLVFKQYYLTKRFDRVQQKNYIELFIGGNALGRRSMILFAFDEVGTLVDTGGADTEPPNYSDGL